MGKYIKKVKGDLAEKQAVKLLKKKKYKIIERNFLCKTGEIDIIAWDKEFNELVFVEVRFRSSSLDDAISSITPAKRKRIIRAAKYFLLTHKDYSNCLTRFDIIAVTRSNEMKWIIEHLPQAFTP